MKYQPLNPELFRINRKRFVRQMKADSIAILHSNDLMPRNGDQFFPFRQNSHLFSLSGLDQAETVLVLFPNCVKEDCREMAFIKKNSERSAIWEGQKYTKETARKVSGIQKIHWLDEMDKVLNELILLSKRIYLNTNENAHFFSEVPSRDLRMAKTMMERYPLHKYHRAQPLLKNLSMIKSHHEVKVIQESIDITEKAFRRVLDFVRPGVMEYEIEAEIIHEFIRNRATGHAYSPIVASGSNACVLHYNANNQVCQNGNLLLLDFGAEYANYAADLSRTIPVNGQFTARQKAVYQSVLKVMKMAIPMLVPGTSLEDYHKEVGKMMESELRRLKLIDKTDIKNQPADRPAYKKYFMHGTSHHLGLDVHDLSNRYLPIQAGMVFTCEPGIYIPEEGFGIRLENNILVTDNDPIDLTADIPIEAEEIEALVGAKVFN
ncbi:MAG: aminopeptidase P family protein [Bacteroidota bacterium]